MPLALDMTKAGRIILHRSASIVKMLNTKEQIKEREDPTHELILYPFSLRSQGKLLVLKGKNGRRTRGGIF